MGWKSTGIIIIFSFLLANYVMDLTETERADTELCNSLGYEDAKYLGKGTDLYCCNWGMVQTTDLFGNAWMDEAPVNCTQALFSRGLLLKKEAKT